MNQMMVIDEVVGSDGGELEDGEIEDEDGQIPDSLIEELLLKSERDAAAKSDKTASSISNTTLGLSISHSQSQSSAIDNTLKQQDVISSRARDKVEATTSLGTRKKTPPLQYRSSKGGKERERHDRSEASGVRAKKHSVVKRTRRSRSPISSSGRRSSKGFLNLKGKDKAKTRAAAPKRRSRSPASRYQRAKVSRSQDQGLIEFEELLKDYRSVKNQRLEEERRLSSGSPGNRSSHDRTRGQGSSSDLYSGSQSRLKDTKEKLGNEQQDADAESEDEEMMLLQLRKDALASVAKGDRVKDTKLKSSDEAVSDEQSALGQETETDSQSDLHVLLPVADEIQPNQNNNSQGDTEEASVDDTIIGSAGEDGLSVSEGQFDNYEEVAMEVDEEEDGNSKHSPELREPTQMDTSQDLSSEQLAQMSEIEEFRVIDAVGSDDGDDNDDDDDDESSMRAELLKDLLKARAGKDLLKARAGKVSDSASCTASKPQSPSTLSDPLLTDTPPLIPSNPPTPPQPLIPPYPNTASRPSSSPPTHLDMACEPYPNMASRPSSSPPTHLDMACEPYPNMASRPSSSPPTHLDMACEPYPNVASRPSSSPPTHLDMACEPCQPPPSHLSVTMQPSPPTPSYLSMTSRSSPPPPSYPSIASQQSHLSMASQPSPPPSLPPYLSMTSQPSPPPPPHLSIASRPSPPPQHPGTPPNSSRSSSPVTTCHMQQSLPTQQASLVGPVQAKAKPPVIPVHQPVVITVGDESDDSEDDSASEPFMGQLDTILKEFRMSSNKKTTSDSRQGTRKSDHHSKGKAKIKVPKTPDAIKTAPTPHRKEYHRLREEIARREQHRAAPSTGRGQETSHQPHRGAQEKRITKPSGSGHDSVNHRSASEKRTDSHKGHRHHDHHHDKKGSHGSKMHHGKHHGGDVGTVRVTITQGGEELERKVLKETNQGQVMSSEESDTLTVTDMQTYQKSVEDLLKDIRSSSSSNIVSEETLVENRLCNVVGDIENTQKDELQLRTISAEGEMIAEIEKKRLAEEEEKRRLAEEEERRLAEEEERRRLEHEAMQRRMEEKEELRRRKAALEKQKAEEEKMRKKELERRRLEEEMERRRVQSVEWQKKRNKYSVQIKKDRGLHMYQDQQITKRSKNVNQAKQQIENLKEQIQNLEKTLSMNQAQMIKHVNQRAVIEDRMVKFLTLDDQARSQLAQLKGVSVDNIDQSEYRSYIIKACSQGTPSVIGGKRKVDSATSAALNMKKAKMGKETADLKRLQEMERSLAEKIQQFRQAEARKASVSVTGKSVIPEDKVKRVRRLSACKPSAKIYAKDVIKLSSESTKVTSDLTQSNSESEGVETGKVEAAKSEEGSKVKVQEERRKSWLDENPTLTPNLKASSKPALISVTPLSPSLAALGKMKAKFKSEGRAAQTSSGHKSNISDTSVEGDLLQWIESSEGKDANPSTESSNFAKKETQSASSSGLKHLKASQLKRIKTAQSESEKTGPDFPGLNHFFSPSVGSEISLDVDWCTGLKSATHNSDLLGTDSTSVANPGKSVDTNWCKDISIERDNNSAAGGDMEASNEMGSPVQHGSSGLGVYRSPLLAFKAFRLSPLFQTKAGFAVQSSSFTNKLDSSTPLCQYELKGTCNDDDCAWQHERDYTMSTREVITDLLSYKGLQKGDPQRIRESPVKTRQVKHASDEKGKIEACIENVLDGDNKGVVSRLISTPRTWRPRQRARSHRLSSGDDHAMAEILPLNPPKYPQPSVKTTIKREVILRAEEETTTAGYVRKKDAQEKFVDPSVRKVVDLETAVLDHPHNIGQWLHLAQSLLQDSRVDKTLNALSRGLEQNSQSQVLWLEYLRVYKERASHTEYLEMCSKATELAPCYHTWWELLEAEKSIITKLEICNKILQFLKCSKTQDSAIGNSGNRNIDATTSNLSKDAIVNSGNATVDVKTSKSTSKESKTARQLRLSSAECEDSDMEVGGLSTPVMAANEASMIVQGQGGRGNADSDSLERTFGHITSKTTIVPTATDSNSTSSKINKYQRQTESMLSADDSLRQTETSASAEDEDRTSDTDIIMQVDVTYTKRTSDNQGKDIFDENSFSSPCNSLQGSSRGAFDQSSCSTTLNSTLDTRGSSAFDDSVCASSLNSDLEISKLDNGRKRDEQSRIDKSLREVSHQVLEILLYRAQLHLNAGSQGKAMADLQKCLEAFEGGVTGELLSLLVTSDLCLLWLSLMHIHVTGSLPPSLFDPCARLPSHVVKKELFVIPWKSAESRLNLQNIYDLFERASKACSNHGNRKCPEPDRTGTNNSELHSDSPQANPKQFELVGTGTRLLHLARIDMQEQVGSMESLDELTQEIMSDCKKMSEGAEVLHHCIVALLNNQATAQDVSLYVAFGVRTFPHSCRFHHLQALLNLHTNQEDLTPLRQSIFKFYQITKEEEEKFSGEQVLKLYRHKLRLSLPLDFDPPTSSPAAPAQLSQVTKLYMWLNYILLTQRLLGERLACEAFESALISVQLRQGVEQVWIQYLKFVSGLETSCPRRKPERFLKLVTRCLTSVATQFSLPFARYGETWNDFAFHNRVIDVFLQTVPDSEKMEAYEKLQMQMPDNIHLAFRACQYAVESRFTQLGLQIAYSTLHRHPQCLVFWKIVLSLALQSKRFKEVQALYEHAVLFHYMDASLWRDFLAFLITHDDDETKVTDVLERCQEIGLQQSCILPRPTKS